MLTNAQYALLKFSEECNEAAQRAAKQIQYGRNEAQPDHASNAARLREEILDILIWVDALENLGEIAPINYDDAVNHMLSKIPKITRYKQHARTLGNVE